MLSRLWEHCHKMLHKYRPQHWLLVSAPLRQLFMCLKLNFTATSLPVWDLLLFSYSGCRILPFCNLSAVNLVLLLFCRWYKWLPPTSLIQCGIPPAGTICGKHQTQHMLTFTQHLHTDFSLKQLLLPWLWTVLKRDSNVIQIPYSNFITSHVITQVPQTSLWKWVHPTYMFCLPRETYERFLF